MCCSCRRIGLVTLDRPFSFDRSPSPVKGDLIIVGDDEMRGIVTLARDADVRLRRQR